MLTTRGPGRLSAGWHPRRKRRPRIGRRRRRRRRRARAGATAACRPVWVSSSARCWGVWLSLSIRQTDRQTHKGGHKPNTERTRHTRISTRISATTPSQKPPRLFRVGRGADHRGRLLETDIDAVAGGVCDGLLGLVVEKVLLQAAAGRSQGGVRWALERCTRDPPVRREDVAAAHAAHNGGQCYRVDGYGEGACAFASECRKGRVNGR